ncbi:hypothetical protein EG328_003286 [Venturia inaequalis]|uniref:Uncharacterized protein n=1 Tax=Venturia inaequalis TaxID=5025 RepID=A0A8H3UTX1_VENIN|nr:hypothetical protein EG328_003286 [Venturia inaequalis]
MEKSESGRQHFKAKKYDGLSQGGPSSQEDAIMRDHSLVCGPSTRLSLPNEIVDIIATHLLDANDILSSGKVSKTFVASMNKALYSYPRIGRGNTDLLTLAQFTRTITCNPGLASLIHTLELGDLEPDVSMGKRRSMRLKAILRDEGQMLRQAGKRKSVVSLLRDRSSKPALLDDFYALLVSHLSNLQSLTLHIYVQRGRDHFSHTTRIQSLDQLDPSLFKTLEKFSIFTLWQDGVVHYEAAPKCPKFVESLLKVESLRKFSTGHSLPVQLPTTNITTFDKGTVENHWPWISVGGRSRFFFTGGAKIDTVMWNSHCLPALFTVDLPETVRTLILYESKSGNWSYNKNYDVLLGRIETLHLHCNIITYTDEPGPPGNWEFVKPAEGWLVLISPTIKTLRVFELEKFKNPERFRSQLSKVQSGHHRFPQLGPIQFQATIEGEKAGMERLVEQEFECIKEACGAVPIEFSVVYR